MSPYDPQKHRRRSIRYPLPASPKSDIKSLDANL